MFGQRSRRGHRPGSMRGVSAGRRVGLILTSCWRGSGSRSSSESSLAPSCSASCQPGRSTTTTTTTSSSSSSYASSPLQSTSLRSIERHYDRKRASGVCEVRSWPSLARARGRGWASCNPLLSPTGRSCVSLPACEGTTRAFETSPNDILGRQEKVYKRAIVPPKYSLRSDEKVSLWMEHNDLEVEVRDMTKSGAKKSKIAKWFRCLGLLRYSRRADYGEVDVASWNVEQSVLVPVAPPVWTATCQ